MSKSTGPIFAKFSVLVECRTTRCRQWFPPQFNPGSCRTSMAVDDQYLKLAFRSLEGRCRSNQLLLVLSTELIRWTQAASGAAGRANVALCRASIVVQHLVNLYNMNTASLWKIFHHSELKLKPLQMFSGSSVSIYFPMNAPPYLRT